jgi:SAM-dependent methyltransferase
MTNKSIHNKDYRAELYDEYVSSFKKKLPTLNLNYHQKFFRKQFIPLIKDFNKEASIIEFGCGPGKELQLLKDEGYYNLFGVDISEEQIQEAKSRNLNVELMDIFNFFKINKKKYDIIFAIDFIEHFHKKELVNLFEGFNKILNESGVLILRTPNGEGLFPGRIIYGDLTHLTIFNTYSLTQILQKTGFTDIKFFESFPIFNEIYGFFRTVVWKATKFIVNIIRISEGASTIDILTQNIICTSKKQ